MSSSSSSDAAPPPPLHPIVTAAAAGEFPVWTVAGPSRRAHMSRVSRLMRDWASALHLEEMESERWAAAGLLHDVLREEEPSTLRPRVPEALRELPGAVLHGPATAVRLAEEGVVDPGLLLAVGFHTLGHPDFDALGRALSAADFLEPGRTSLTALRDPLRARMPDDLDGVLKEIMAARLRHLLNRGHPVSPLTVACWNTLVGDRA